MATMEADGASKTMIQIIHGSQKYELELAEEEMTEDELNVGYLAQQVVTLTGVSLEKQKLIFKGKSLSDQQQTLKSVGLKKGSKVMLIGKKFSEEDERLIKCMNKVDETVYKAAEKLCRYIREVDGIKQGFLDGEKKKVALKKVGKKLACVSEELSKQFGALDALSLTDAAKDVKHKRKQLADRINKSLDVCEKKRGETLEMLTNGDDDVS